MFCRKIGSVLLVGGLTLGLFNAAPNTAARGDDKANQEAARKRARDHWQDVVLFYGDEETGEWSLRIRDKDVHERAWFEFQELWQFNPKEKRWEQLKTEKIARPIVLAKQKTSDQPEDSQTLMELKDIEPKTAGVWYAKWKVDEVECSTLMRVGTWKADKKPAVDIPHGMMQLAVPLTLDKAELMIIPDPQIYCVAGGKGKPEEGAAKPAPKKPVK